jgi:hypothetical protein
MTNEQDRSMANDLSDNVRSVLSLPETWADPPPALQDEILSSMRAERDRAGSTPSNVTDLAARDSHRRVTSRRARRPFWVGIAAAAALAVAVAVGISTLRGSSPDETVALVGTELAPTASGQAEISSTPSGFRIDLDIDGLAPATPGTYYQAWLKNAAGDLVTIGTFHARGGGHDIVLWSAVDPQDYSTLTVTLQRDGAGAESSGQVVLAGPVT